VGQSPAGGSIATAGTIVVIEVSNGQAEGRDVPNVVGLRADQAESILRNAGFGVSVDYLPTGEQGRQGTVADQSPHGGAKVQEGATVAILVYEYEAPPQEEPPGQSGGKPGKGKGKGKGKGDD
jgi:eukaryotic-like serine/threonine-protein kinase